MSNDVVIARFDDATDKRFADVCDKLRDAGYAIPEWPPHITIAAYENMDERPICEWTEAFAASHNRIQVGLYSMSVLPPGKGQTTAVLCVAPSHSKAFVDFYYAFHAKYEEYCTGIGYYNAISHGNPIMHATLSVVDIKDIQAAVSIVLESAVYGTAKIVALEVYAYPMRLIGRYCLSQ